MLIWLALSAATTVLAALARLMLAALSRILRLLARLMLSAALLLPGLLLATLLMLGFCVMVCLHLSRPRSRKPNGRV